MLIYLLRAALITGCVTLPMTGSDAQTYGGGASCATGSHYDAVRDRCISDNVILEIRREEASDAHRPT